MSAPRKSFSTLSHSKKAFDSEECPLKLKCRNSENNSRIPYLLSINAFHFIFSIFIAIVQPFGKEADPGVYLAWTFINVLVFLLIFSIVAIKRQKLPLQITITIFQIYIILNWVELAKKLEYPWDSSMNLMFGLILELVMLGPALTHCNPLFSAISSLLPSVYFTLRVLMPCKENKFMWITACVLIGNSVFIIIWSFIREYYSRQSFFRQNDAEKNLERYEEIIKKIIPSAIVIVQKQNIVFFNDETRKLLQISSNFELEKRFDQIFLEEKLINEMKNQVPTGKYEPVNLTTEAGSLSLNDLIRLFIRISNGEEKKFMSYSGTLNPLKDPYLSDVLQKHLDIKIGSLPWEGEDCFMIVITEDRTIDKVEILAKQSQYKDDLLATVSHDLRSPLNAIIGIIETVSEEIDSEELKNSLETALGSSKLLLYIINDILDFSQMKNGKLRIQPSKFDIVESIRDITMLVKPQARRKGLNMEFLNLFPPSEQLIVYNDPNRLKQVLLNLISNAMKFTEKGSIKVSIAPLGEPETEICEKQGASVTVAVQDSGRGIKEEDLPKLFNRFGKLDESRKLNAQGVGLGLEISQSLVKEMNLNKPGEEIRVASEYGKGSLFSFNLHSMPFEETEKKQMKYLSSKQIKELSQFIVDSLEEYSNKFTIPKFKVNNTISENFTLEAPQIRVLLVDDDHINLMVLKMYLKGSPEFQYDFAFNGKQAVDLVLEAASKGIFYDIILIDSNMPVMNGLEAAEEILTLEEQKLIPKVFLIGLSADDSEGQRKRGRHIGMTDYWTKPIRKFEFIDSLRKYSARLLAERERI